MGFMPAQGDIESSVPGAFAVGGALTALSAGITNAITAGSAGITNAITAGSASITNDMAAGTATITNAASSSTHTLTGSVVTNGTMTRSVSAQISSVVHKFSWTNAMIVALGAALTGDITICTLPSKTVVKRVWVVLSGQAAGPATLTVAIGRAGAAYIDYIIALTLKAAANTIYGAVVGDLGTNLTGYDLPSVTGTTAVKAHFIATVANLDGTTGSSGDIYIETIQLP